MNHLADLLAVTPTFALRLVLALLDVSPGFDRVRRLVWLELRFREMLVEDLAQEAAATSWAPPVVGVA